jgi:hypothetical protein
MGIEVLACLLQCGATKIWDWLNGDDPAKVQRVTSAVWAMQKMDLGEVGTRGGCGSLAVGSGKKRFSHR